MDWLRSALLDTLIRTHQPIEQLTVDEPHTHEERWEPQQEVTCEIRGGSGRAAGKVAKPTLILSGTSGWLVQCFNHNTDLWRPNATIPEKPDFRVRIREGAPSSFRKRKLHLFKSFPQATWIPGTRIRIRLDNIGIGVRILVPVVVPLIACEVPGPSSQTTNDSQPGATNARLRLVETDATTGISPPDSPFIPPTAVGQLTEVTPYSRRAYVTYEVVDSEPRSTHEATINFYVAFISNTAHGIPELGQMTASTGFAPGPNVTAAEPSPRDALRIYPPQCGLLFPYVTSGIGFETRITIANTSLDPFGTTPQHGSVFLFFYDGSASDGAPTVRHETEPIRAGHTLVLNLSTGGNGVPPMPGF